MKQFELDLAGSADESPIFGHRRAFPGGVLNFRVADHTPGAVTFAALDERIARSAFR